MKALAYLLSVLIASGLPTCVHAQIAVSANDGKQFPPGERSGTRTADSVSIIDLGDGRPRVIGTVAAPASMIGPPTSVAVAPDESFVLVTAAQALEGGSIVKDDSLSIIDLADPANPRIVQTLRAGPGASGVAINREGTLALVAGTGDDAISVFSIDRKRLTRIGTVRLDYQSRPTDVAFSPDGRTALVVTQSAGAIVRLAIDGTRVTRTGIEIKPGRSPYGITISRDGRLAINTNLEGRLRPGEPTPPANSSTVGSVTVIDLASNRVVDDVDVGLTPEHVALSPDGEYVAVVVLNGTNALPESKDYKPNGLMQVYRLDGARLVRVAESATGPWCQGAAWSGNGATLLLQCALGREIEVYRFDGRSLARDLSATIKLGARPGALSTALSR